MKTINYFSGVFLILLMITSRAGHSQKITDSKITRALTQVHKILNDPLMSDEFHTAKFSLDIKRSEPNFYVFQAPTTSKDGRLTTLNIGVYADGSFNFRAASEHELSVQSVKEPEWEKEIVKWDGFVKRHWPQLNLKRDTDWRKAIAKYKPGGGNFLIQYSYIRDGFNLYHVALDIRLGDGKVNEISVGDNRYYFRSYFKNKSVPPPPPKDKVIAAIMKALSKRTTPWHKTARNLREIYRDRSLRIEQKNGQPFVQGIIQWGRYQAEVMDGKPVEIAAWYEEWSGNAGIDAVYQPRQEPRYEKGKSFHKPFTDVSDDKPFWGGKDQNLYFTTYRDVKNRPWWQRDSVLTSIASVDSTSKSLSLSRPVKPIGQDQAGYYYCLPSPNGKYLALTRDPFDKQIFFLDLQQGRVYFPEPKGLTKWAARIISPQEENPPLRLEIAGADWLPDEHGLILSLTNKDRDPNLYVARWPKNAPPREIELVPIVLELGTDVLPRLGRDGKTLAWARKIYKRERDKLPDEKDQWQLLVADFTPDNLVTRAPQPKEGEILYAQQAIAKLNTRNRRTLDLPDEPLSIAWDNVKARWLVVTRTKVLWVREVDGQLQSAAAPELKWKDIALKPTSADVSRDGKIAIAAELATPQVYPKSECVVRSLIFGWDGQSTSVQPLYEPSLNGIARYVFPATKSPWARIEGNAKRLGLEGLADPASFVSSTSAAP